jgi:hypothetical protein
VVESPVLGLLEERKGDDSGENCILHQPVLTSPVLSCPVLSQLSGLSRFGSAECLEAVHVQSRAEGTRAHGPPFSLREGSRVVMFETAALDPCHSAPCMHLHAA